MATITNCSMLKDGYVVFLEAQVLEERPVAGQVVLIELVADEGLGVFDHVVVDVQLIAHEVKGKGEADDEGQPAGARGCVEVHPLHYHRDCYVQDRCLVDLVEDCPVLHLDRFEGLFVGPAPYVGDQCQHPACQHQQQRHVHVVNEEA